MDTPPIPKPRSTFLNTEDATKRPVPLPRTKAPINNDKVTASDILHSIGSFSKQITDEVAQKVASSAKSANEKIEKSIIDGSKFAKGKLEKTITTSRAVRDSVTKSVIEGTKTASLKLRLSKKLDGVENENDESARCTSMPIVDVSLFDNIQFHSPLLEQKRIQNENQTHINQQISHAINQDDVSIVSNNSDSNTDTVSNLSYEIKELEQNESPLHQGTETTYDTPKPSRTNSMVSIRSAPDVPDRRRKRTSGSEVMRQNSLYENWTLPSKTSQDKDPETNSRLSKYTLLEFDPLNKSLSSPKYEGVSNELILLESFLVGDTYGTIIASDNGNDEINYDFNERDYFNPPTPPERFDSLFPNDINNTEASESSKKSSNWYDDPATLAATESKPSSSMIQKFSTIFKLDNVLNKQSKQNAQKVETVEKPPINNLPIQYYSGILNKVVSGVVEDLFKNSQSRYCLLSDQKLMCYTDPTSSILKESYLLDNITSLQIVLPLSSSTTSNSYCFELTVSTGAKSNPRKILFSCGSAPERRNWAQKIAEHLTTGFPTKYTSEFTRCGWCYLKEGVSGEWRGAWLMLIRRILVYYTNPETTKSVDLRKTRCVVTRDADEETKTSCPSDGSPNLLLDCPHATLYLRFPHDRELKGWKYMVKLAAHNNGAYIHHQQLTKDDVPTIVDKCISFIYSHGTLSEGIYRRAGSSLVLSELLAKFRRDAWSVQLIHGEHSEHDVAGVLKRFFRDLPESLIPRDKHTELISALDIKEKADRHAEYRRVILSLPLVAKNTAKKLFAHLHFLDSMANVNKMGAENLSSVWAPTIMPAALTGSTIETAWSAKEQYVVRDLIVNYEDVWQPTEDELRREAAVRRILMRVMKSVGPAQTKAAGDLRVWVYIHDRTNCYQIALTPNKTSGDVCIELCEKAKMDSHLLMLEEVICNESMRRVVHVDEIALDVVLRWGYWDEEDRKDNYLLVKENRILHELQALRNTNSLVCGELRFANGTNKAFRSHMFEFNNGKLCYFKDKQGSHKVEEWHVKQLLWYVGHEPKRNPQSRWAITFIPRDNKQRRSKEHPWFGCTIAGAVTDDQLKWMTALMFAEHSEILPTPRLVVT